MFTLGLRANAYLIGTNYKSYCSRKLAFSGKYIVILNEFPKDKMYITSDNVL